MVVPPDNRCCFCLTLRGGVVLISALDILFYLITYSWYAGSIYLAPGWSVSELTNLDISVFVVFLVQILVNVLLAYGALRKIPSHTVPWLCANSVVIGILLVLLGMLMFFGSGRMDLSYSQFCSALVMVGLGTAVHLFCCIVVFQYRRNVMVEAIIQSERAGMISSAPPLLGNTPPPSYDEVSAYKDIEAKASLDKDVEQPPEYDAAMSMLADAGTDQMCREDNEKRGTSIIRKRSETSIANTHQVRKRSDAKADQINAGKEKEKREAASGVRKRSF